MNTDQAVRRIKNVLRAARWGDTGDSVFSRDSVYATLAPAASKVSEIKVPAAFIRPVGGNADTEVPGILTRNIAVRLLDVETGDPLGESALIGAHRLSKTGIGGRGLLGIESELFRAIELLNNAGQFRIALQTLSVGEPALIGGDYHVSGEYTFKAGLSTAYQYQEPRSVSATESGGTVTISWSAPDDVTNLVGYIVRRVSGTVPVAYPTGGTDVPWTTGTSTTDAPGSGTYTYCVFAAYDPAGGSLEHEISDYGDDWVEF